MRPNIGELRGMTHPERRLAPEKAREVFLRLCRKSGADQPHFRHPVHNARGAWLPDQGWSHVSYPPGTRRTTSHVEHVLEREDFGRLVDKTSIISFHAIFQWLDSGEPIYVLDEEVAFALSRTSLPRDPLGQLPRMPADAIYIALPPIFKVWNDETLLHDVEGVYVVTDRVSQGREVVDSLLIIVVGKSLGADPEHEALIEQMIVAHDIPPDLSRELRDSNDALAWMHVSAELDIEAKISESRELQQGLREGVRVALNLLVALSQTKTLSTRLVEPTQKKSPGKQKKLSRRGVSTHPYTTVSLSRGRSLERPGAPAGPRNQGEPASPRRHIVPGHWTHRWVREPGPDDVAHATKPSEKGDGVLHSVLRWIWPYARGEGPETPQTVLVKA